MREREGIIIKCEYNGVVIIIFFFYKSEMKDYDIYHYGWKLLIPTPRKNIEKTKSIIQILNQGGHKSPCIVTENVHAKKEQVLLKITKSERSSKIKKLKRN